MDAGVARIALDRTVMLLSSSVREYSRAVNMPALRSVLSLPIGLIGSVVAGIDGVDPRPGT